MRFSSVEVGAVGNGDRQFWTERGIVFDDDDAWPKTVRKQLAQDVIINSVDIQRKYIRIFHEHEVEYRIDVV